jgi:hypothetical protein
MSTPRTDCPAKDSPACTGPNCGHCRVCGKVLDNHNGLAVTVEGRAKTTCPKLP